MCGGSCSDNPSGEERLSLTYTGCVKGSGSHRRAESFCFFSAGMGVAYNISHVCIQRNISAFPPLHPRETTRERKEYFFCAFSKQGNMGNGGREGREIGEGKKRNCVVRAWECVHESGLFPPVAITKAARGEKKGENIE